MKRLTPEEIAIALEEIINALARLEARVAKCEQPAQTGRK